MIPKRIHFIYGLVQGFSDIPFSYVHYIAVHAAKVINPSYELVMHYFHEPRDNEWWERIKPYVVLDRLASVPEFIHGRKVKHHAHMADLLRLEILSSEGGIYLDVDTLCILPFDPLLSYPFTMGIEVCNGMLVGLCNAVILAEQRHEFLNLWMNEFVSFAPDDWNKMAVRKPFEVFSRNSTLVHIEPPESFFRLAWNEEDLRAAHEEVIPYHRSYLMHLWEAIAYKKYLSKITEEDVLTRDSTYNILARNVLKLPAVGI
jgi:hypothetical protein